MHERKNEMSHFSADLGFLADVSARMRDWLEAGLSGRTKVRGEVRPEVLHQQLKSFSSAAEQGLSRERWLELVDVVLANSTHSIQSGFLNQLYGGFQPPGIAGDWLATLLNMSMATLEISPVATVIESILFERARELVGYPAASEAALAGGTLAPGGSNGNMVALLIARNSRYPETKQAGLAAGRNHSRQPLCFFISKDAHYSFGKAANAMGIGTDHVIGVDVDESGRMVPSALARAVAEARAAGLEPFFVGATAGTTVRAAFDPIGDIADVCAAEGLWLHVDAALGGTMLFSKSARGLLAGLDRADSLVWDAHKLMNVPLVASILLCRNPAHLVESNSGGGEDYLFHAGKENRWDTGVSSLQCGRRADVLKIFFAWVMTGETNWGHVIDEHLSRTSRFAVRVAADSRLELVYPAETVSLCFRVKGVAQAKHGKNASEPIDQLALRELLAREGRFMVNYAHDKNGQPFFRLIALNNLVTDEVYEDLFSSLLRLAGHGNTARLR